MTVNPEMTCRGTTVGMGNETVLLRPMQRDGTREATQITYSRQGRVNWLPTPKRTLNPHQTFRILPQGTERPQNQAQQQGQEQARGPEQAPAILSEPFIFTEQELLDIARLNRGKSGLFHPKHCFDATRLSLLRIRQGFWAVLVSLIQSAPLSAIVAGKKDRITLRVEDYSLPEDL